MLGDLLEAVGNVVLAVFFQGCLVTLGLLCLSIGAVVAFATGHADEGWGQVGLFVLMLVYGGALLARRFAGDD